MREEREHLLPIICDSRCINYGCCAACPCGHCLGKVNAILALVESLPRERRSGNEATECPQCHDGLIPCDKCGYERRAGRTDWRKLCESVQGLAGELLSEVQSLDSFICQDRCCGDCDCDKTMDALEKRCAELGVIPRPYNAVRANETEKQAYARHDL